MARREALDEIYSLSIADACVRTGWSKNRMYDEIDPAYGGIETYVVGRRRFVIAASLLKRLRELASAPPTMAPESRFAGHHGPGSGLPKPQPAKKRARPLGSRSKTSGQSQFSGLGQPP